MTVELRTVRGFPCSALRGVDVVVASDLQDADERVALRSLSASVPKGQCDADERTVGSLVITPSGSRAAITVIARVDEGASCTKADNYKGCIVARRSFAFIEHAALALPITLEASCKDVPCDVKTSCRAGTCADAFAECSEESGDCISPAEPGPTGGPGPAGEAGSDGPTSDAPSDGPAQDAPIDSATDSGVDGSVVGTPGPISSKCFNGTNPPPNLASGQSCCCPNQSCMLLTNPALCGAGTNYYCTGRLSCGGSLFCCGAESGKGGSCMGPCNIYLCGHDDDCPSDMVCGAPYHVLMTGTFKQCVKK